MQAMNDWEASPEENDRRAVDRRLNRRYDLRLDLRWKLVRRKKVVDQGTGATHDLSSGGVSFEAGRPLSHGLTAELSISWPALLDGVSPLQLVISGRVVRSDGGRIAIRIARHEFRILSLKTNVAKAAAAASASATGQVFRAGAFPTKLQ